MDYESNSPHQHLRECLGNSMENIHTNAKKERVKGCRKSVKGVQVRTLHVTSDWLWYSPSKLACISCEKSRRISFCIKVLISLIPCNPSNLVMVFMKDPCRACQSYWSNLKQLPHESHTNQGHGFDNGKFLLQRISTVCINPKIIPYTPIMWEVILLSK